MSAGTGAPLLVVDELTTEFATRSGAVRAVDRVSFTVERGQAVGVVGESGSGKSVTALSILRLIGPPGRVAGGRVLFEGKDLSGLGDRELRSLRGDRIAMVFQEPMTSLNPVLTAGEQIAEVLRVHRGATSKAAMARAVELLTLVGIPSPDVRARSYPHQLSGGMRQRVMIAMALACDPQLVIADEPTTALDVTVQAQILDLLARLQKDRGTALMLITHDLGVVAETCDAVVVMYAGQVVERGTTREVLSAPRHPYTLALLASRIPDAPDPTAPRRARLPVLSEPREVPAGPKCRFAARCPSQQARCLSEAPALEVTADGRAVRCFFPLGPAEAAA